jgi:hypothetical protein
VKFLDEVNECAEGHCYVESIYGCVLQKKIRDSHAIVISLEPVKQWVYAFVFHYACMALFHVLYFVGGGLLTEIYLPIQELSSMHNQ